MTKRRKLRLIEEYDPIKDESILWIQEWFSGPLGIAGFWKWVKCETTRERMDPLWERAKKFGTGCTTTVLETFS